LEWRFSIVGQSCARARVGCLPVVGNGVLVGIVTATDFLDASAKLFEEQLTMTAARVAGSQM
jgi:CBS domain-containing protein